MRVRRGGPTTILLDPDRVEAAMAARGLGRKDLAQAAHVHVSVVDRARKGLPIAIPTARRMGATLAALKVLPELAPLLPDGPSRPVAQDGQRPEGPSEAGRGTAA